MAGSVCSKVHICGTISGVEAEARASAATNNRRFEVAFIFTSSNPNTPGKLSILRSMSAVQAVIKANGRPEAGASVHFGARAMPRSWWLLPLSRRQATRGRSRYQADNGRTLLGKFAHRIIVPVTIPVNWAASTRPHTTFKFSHVFSKLSSIFDLPGIRFKRPSVFCEGFKTEKMYFMIDFVN